MEPLDIIDDGDEISPQKMRQLPIVDIAYSIEDLIVDLSIEERTLLMATAGLPEFFSTHLTHIATLLKTKESAVAKALLQIPLGRPQSWTGGTSSPPYYKNKYAIAVKKFIDDYFNNNCAPRLWVCATRSTRTQYLMFNQAWHYICDHLDDKTKTYANMFKVHEAVQYHDRHGKRGILLQKRKVSGDAAFNPESQEMSRELVAQEQEAAERAKLEEQLTKVSWRNKLEDWLNTFEEHPLDKFLLTDELFDNDDMMYVQLLAAQYPDLQFNMMNKYLSVVKRKVDAFKKDQS